MEKTNKMAGKSNHLINEKSPYLLEHSNDAVEWYPWGSEAFTRAMSEDKPIFLSIGFSSCHWCHVMKRESFEDEEVAEMINANFVPVKVDREERPDIDSIYMAACHLLNGSGGWPLTIVATPGQAPFFAATYIPKLSSETRIGLLELLPKIREIWDKKRDEVFSSASDLEIIMREMHKPGGLRSIDKSIFERAFMLFESDFDPISGGFGRAPKFPVTSNISFLLRYYKSSKRERALEMCDITLTSLRMGGIFDHLGGGFHRYSTDSQWIVPHFEKMLYDQAAILATYVEAWLATRNPLYKSTAYEIINYVYRNLTSPEGGFYSAEDADSDGIEGNFYTWSFDEINKILPDPELFCRVFNVLPEGNAKILQGQASEPPNVLFMSAPLEITASETGIPAENLASYINTCKSILFREREKRVHPAIDDKILTDWNGLMIASLAMAGKAFDDNALIGVARRCADFLASGLMRGSGKLLHRYRDGEAAIDGMLDDYVFFAKGLIELYEATFDVQYLSLAIGLIDTVISRFEDNSGGFFFNSNDAAHLFARKKEVYDGAIPSGNSVLLLVLLKLWKITANPKYEDKALRLVRFFSGHVDSLPTGYSCFLCGLDFHFNPGMHILISSPSGPAEAEDYIRTARSGFTPNNTVILRAGGPGENEFFSQVLHIGNLGTPADELVVYVCDKFNCSLPVKSIEELKRLLE